MPVGWCESIPFDRLRKWKRNVSKATPYLWPVITTMMATQIIWIGVYQCRDKDNIVRFTQYMAGDESLVRIRTDNNSMATMFHSDKDFHDPNPKTLRDVATESLLLVPILAAMVAIFEALDFLSSKCKKTEEQGIDQTVLSYVAIFIAFFGSRTVIVDVTDVLNIDLPMKLWIAGGLTGAYYCLVFLAFGFEIFPEYVFQYFLATNCVFQSLFMLTQLSAESFWIMTTALFFFYAIYRAWVGRGSNPELQKPMYVQKYPACEKDMDAYLARLLQSLRFIVYKVIVPTSDDGYILGQSEKAPSYQLGILFYGEFILYSALVGQSMTSGIFPGVVSACCVLIGVVCSVNNNSRFSLPYKFIGVLFGYCGHFGTLLVQNALIYLLKTDA